MHSICQVLKASKTCFQIITRLHLFRSKNVHKIVASATDIHQTISIDKLYISLRKPNFYATIGAVTLGGQIIIHI